MAIAVASAQHGFVAAEQYARAGFQTLRTMDTMQRYNAWLWDQVRPYIGQRVLEAGCGMGTFTRYVADRERVVAVDVDHEYVSMLRAEYAEQAHVRVERLDLASAAWPDLHAEVLDSVISMNVLEHVQEDQHVLARFFEVLQPGGRLALVVPAHAHLFGAIDEAVGHYRRYDRHGLHELLTHSGFDVHQLRHLNPTGILGWFLNGRILRRSVVPEGQAAAYDLVYPVLSILDRLRLPFGLSLLAVAQKPT